MGNEIWQLNYSEERPRNKNSLSAETLHQTRPARWILHPIFSWSERYVPPHYQHFSLVIPPYIVQCDQQEWGHIQLILLESVRDSNEQVFYWRRSHSLHRPRPLWCTCSPTHQNFGFPTSKQPHQSRLSSNQFVNDNSHITMLYKADGQDIIHRPTWYKDMTW